MQLSISTTYKPATDLGYLLHKNPEKIQEFEITGGKAYVFYPEASENRCTATMLLNIDNMDLARVKKLTGSEFMLQNYVNDRPFTASSFMSGAISNVFSSALNGNSRERPELATKPIPLEVYISVIKVVGGERLIKRVFEPLGYEIEIERYELNEKFPAWGEGSYYSIRLKNNITLKEMLSHLYVLFPVFDNDKHYWVSTNDIDILLKKGEGWLNNHPEREFITERYFKNIKKLSKIFNERLNEGEIEEEKESVANTEEMEKKMALDKQRLNFVLERIVESGVKSIIDLGCGEGKLLKLLLHKKQFEKIGGMDVSFDTLLKAKERLNFEELPEKQRDRIDIFQSSLTYKDKRLMNYEACAIVEVIEHLDEDRLESLERNVFKYAKFSYIILTTPNEEYNINYSGLKKEAMRHRDHRFEWNRAEFKSWVDKISQKYGYSARISGVGEEDELTGYPTQVVEFKVYD